jgi:uncharacterized protein YbjT (DUF2867 family)
VRATENICRNRILVIGASGHVGAEVVSGLLAKGTEVRAMTRNPASAGLPLEAEVVYGDLALPETLDTCLDGIDTVFMVWCAPADAAAPALERIAKRARRIVYLSAPLKTPHPFFQQPNPSRALAERIEGLIESSGLGWTFLRPGIFALNSVGWWSAQIRAGDVARWPYTEVHTAPIHQRDIAEVAVETLCNDEHAGREYVLTGPQSLNQAEQIAIIGDVIGRSLRVEEISRDEAERELPMPPFVLKMLLDAWSAASGQPAFITSAFAEILKRPPRTFRDWAMENAAEFRQVEQTPGAAR